MKRILLVGLLFVVFFSFSLPVLAADAPEVQLNNLGLLQNISAAELDAGLTRDVGIAMILKAIGFTQAEADAAASNGYFTDVSGWATGWAELAYIQGITTGVGDHRFDPKGKLSEQQFVAFLLRALEYDSSESWNKAETLGYQAGLTVMGNALNDPQYTKRKASIVMYNALTAELQASHQLLVNRLIDKGVITDVAAELHGIIPSAFVISGRKHTNMKEVIITFSKGINSATLNGTTFKVSNGDTALTYDADISNGTGSMSYGFEQLSDSELRVVFGTPFTESNRVKFVIEGLQSVNGDVLSTSFEYRMRDLVAPKVTDVSAIASDRLVVSFTEPVQFKTGNRVYDNVLIDAVPVNGEADFNYDRTALIFTLKVPISPGQHTFSFGGMVDYIGTSGLAFEGSFELVEDTAGPEVISAVLLDSRNLVLTLSEVVVEERGSVSLDGISYDLDKSDLVGNKVHLYLSVPISVSGGSMVPVTYSDLVDWSGNKSGEKVINAKAVEDMTAPKMLATKVDTDEIRVIFSEDVQNVDGYHIVVTNSEGNLVQIKNMNSIEGMKSMYTIKLVEPMTSKKTYYLTAKGIKDIAVTPNAMAETVLYINNSDTTRPKVNSVTALSAQTIRVIFSESMNGSYLENLENYQMYDSSEGKLVALSDMSGVELTASESANQVDIKIPKLEGSDKILIWKLRDRSGNLISDYGKTFTATSTDTFGAANVSAQLTGARTILITTSGHSFASIEPKDFKFKIAAGESPFIYVTSARLEGSDKAYLTLNTDMDGDGTYLGEKQYLYMDGAIGTEDTYGKSLVIEAAEAVSIAEKIRPTVTLDIEGSGQLRLEFSEMMKAKGNSELTSDITIKEANGDRVTLTPGINMFYIGGSDFSYRAFNELMINGLDEDGLYSITVGTRQITDLSGNTVTGLSKSGMDLK